MTVLTKLIVDCSTGEQTEVPLTAQELAGAKVPQQQLAALIG